MASTADEAAGGAAAGAAVNMDDDRKMPAPEPEGPAPLLPHQAHLLEEALPFILECGFLGLDARKVLARVSRGCHASTRDCVYSIAGDARLLPALDRFPRLQTLRLTVGKRSDESWRLPKGYGPLWATEGGFLGRVPLLRSLEMEVERDKKPKEKRKTKKQREQEEAAAKAKAAKAAAEEEDNEDEDGNEEGANAVVIVMDGEEGAAAAQVQEDEETGGGGGGKKKRRKKGAAADTGAAEADAGGKKKRASKGKGKAVGTAAADAAAPPAPKRDEIEEPLLLLKGLPTLGHLRELRLEVRHPGAAVQAGLARVLREGLPASLEELAVVVQQVGGVAGPLLAGLLRDPGLPRLRALRVIGEGPAPAAADAEAARSVRDLLLAITRTRTPRMEEVALLGGLPRFPDGSSESSIAGDEFLPETERNSPLAALMARPDSLRWYAEEAPKGLTIEVDDDASFQMMRALLVIRHPMGMAMYAASALHFGPDQLPTYCRRAMVDALSPDTMVMEKCLALRAITAFLRMGGGIPGMAHTLQERVEAIVLHCLRQAAAAAEAEGGAAETSTGAVGTEVEQLTERILLLLHACAQAVGRGTGGLAHEVFTGTGVVPIAGLALRALAQRAPATAYRAGAEGLVWLLRSYHGAHSGEMLAKLGRMALLPEAAWDAFAETPAEGTLRLLGLVLDRSDAFAPGSRASLCRLFAWALLDTVAEAERPLFIEALRESGLLARMTALWLREHQPAVLLGLASQEPGSLPDFFADVLLRRIPVDDLSSSTTTGGNAVTFMGFGRALTGLCATAQTTALLEAFPGRGMTRETLEGGRAAFLAALLAAERAKDLWRALAQDCARVGAVTLLEILQKSGERGLLGAMGPEEKALIGRQIDALKVASQRPRLWVRCLRPHFFGSPAQHLEDVLARLEPAIAFTASGKLKGVKMGLVEELVVALAGVEEAIQQGQQHDEMDDFPPALAAKVDAVLTAMGREEAAARLDKVLEGCKLARHIINLAGTKSKQRWATPRLRLVGAAFAALGRAPVGSFVSLLAVDEAAEVAWKEEAAQQRAKKAAAARRKSGGAGGGGADPGPAVAALLGYNRNDPLYIPRGSALAALLSIQGSKGAGQQQPPPPASPSPCLLEHWVEALCGTKEPWLHAALARACRHPRTGQAVLQALVDLPRWIPQTNMGRLAKGLAMLLAPVAGLLPALTPEEEGEGQDEEGEGGDGEGAEAAAEEEEEDENEGDGAAVAAAMDVDGAAGAKGEEDDDGATVSPAALLACLTTTAGDDAGGGGGGELEFRLEDRVPALVMALYRHPSPGARRLFAPSSLVPDAPARLVRMLLRLLTGGGAAASAEAGGNSSSPVAAAASNSSSGSNSFATRSLAEVLSSGGDGALGALTALATAEQLLAWRAYNAVRLLAEERPAFVLPVVLDAAAAGAPGLGSIVADALRSCAGFALACVEGHLPALLRFLVAVSAGKGRAGVGLTALDLIASAAGAVPDFGPRVGALVEAEKEKGAEEEEGSATASLRRLVEALAGDRRVHRDATHKLLLDELMAILPSQPASAAAVLGSGGAGSAREGAAAAATGRAERARKRQRS